MKIFVSYSSKDREMVRALADDLESLGHQVWFDQELSRTGGQRWWANILAHIRDCELFIFALTPNSLASDPCQREYKYAHAVNKRILPIMMAPINILVLPIELQELQFVDYRERGAKQALALAGSLSNLPPARPLPDPLPPEPETPLSPLARLSQQIGQQSLSSSEQAEIYFELEGFYADPTLRASAEELLRRLAARRDLVYSVGERIGRLLPPRTQEMALRPPPSAAPAAQPGHVPQQQYAPQQRAPQQAAIRQRVPPKRGGQIVRASLVLMVAGVAMAIIAIITISALGGLRGATSGTPGATPTTQIAQAPTETPSPENPTDTPEPAPTETIPVIVIASPTPPEPVLPTATDDPTCRIQVTSNALNVRAGPGTDYEVLGQISQGGLAVVIGRSADGAWWYAATDIGVGWVSGSLVTASGNCSVVPVIHAPPTPTPFPPTMTPTVVSTATVFIAPPSATPTVELFIPIAPTDTPSPTPTPTTEPTLVRLHLGDIRYDANNVLQVYVPPGCFKMGSEGNDADELPVHEVCITRGFWMDKLEVTNESWLVFKPGRSSEPADWPKVNVSWFEASEYAKWRGPSCRLPTEAEWEWAARGPESRIWPWGNNRDPSLANTAESGPTSPVSVGSKSGLSWVGAFDLAGNVWEWTADWYDANYYHLLIRENPPGPTRGQFRVLRGGSFRQDLLAARGSDRYWAPPDGKADFVGFRVVCDE